VTIAENLVTYTLKPLTRPKAASTTCRICQRNPHFGYGDNSEPIGLARESLKMILGPNRAADSPVATEVQAGLFTDKPC
jgi:hypothetical protein